MYLRRATNCDGRIVHVFVKHRAKSASSRSIDNVVVVVFAVASFAVVMVLLAQGRSQFFAVEVAHSRLYVSNKRNIRDFIVSTVPSEEVPINIKAHDGMHKAIIASIVVQPGPSFSAGPHNEDEEARKRVARRCC